MPRPAPPAGGTTTPTTPTTPAPTIPVQGIGPSVIPVTTTTVTPIVQTPLVGTATIKEIIVEENTKTDDDTVILISKLEVGDSFSADMADGVKAQLINSGLFKDVIVYWSTVDGGVRIHLLVKDKHSWVIAPAFYNQPTNVGGGVGFGENNLFGQNQKLLVYGQIATGDSFFIGAWVIPSIVGTRFYAQFDTFLKSARNIEYAAPSEYYGDGANPKPVRESRIHYLNGGMKLGMELFRGFKIDSRLRAASVAYVDDSIKLSEGATAADLGLVDGDPIPAPGGEGWDVSNEWTVTIDRRANYYGIQSGYRLGASLEHSLESLGSDFNYWLAGVSFQRAKKIFERHNFVVKGAFGYGRNLPFQQEFRVGGTAMRGWLNDQFRGNLRGIANVEYSLPILPTIKGLSIRGLVFFDSAYTTFTRVAEDDAKRDYLPGSNVRGLEGFKNSVGVGTRFYLRQIVLPLLGLDVGYGLEAGDVQIYLAIGLTD